MRRKLVSFIAVIGLSFGLLGGAISPARAACTGSLCQFKALGTLLGLGLIPGESEFLHDFAVPEATFVGLLNGTVGTAKFSGHVYPGSGYATFNGEFIAGISTSQTVVPVGSLAGAPGLGDIRVISFKGGGLDVTLVAIGGVPGFGGILQQSA